MSRKYTLRVVRDLLEIYQARGDSGTITVDVRNGKAIWVRPVVTDCTMTAQHSCMLDPLGQINQALREFEACDASGTVTIKICAGQAAEVSREFELEKVKVG